MDEKVKYHRGRFKMKNYNPFKMWGSYVSALIFYFGMIIPQPAQNMNFLNVESRLLILFLALMSSFLGFLIGWVIHSLVRYFRK